MSTVNLNWVIFNTWIEFLLLNFEEAQTLFSLIEAVSIAASASARPVVFPVRTLVSVFCSYIQRFLFCAVWFNTTFCWPSLKVQGA